MQNVTLYIENPNESKIVSLGEEELSIGRTELAQLVVDDSGLSRVNTTIFRDDDDIYVTDEKSLNGTFLNAERISGSPKKLFNGDEIKIGSNTRIRVEITDAVRSGESQAIVDRSPEKPLTPASNPQSAKLPSLSEEGRPKAGVVNPKSERPPVVLIVAAGSALGIILIGLIAFLIVSSYEGETGNTNGKRTPPVIKSLLIPVRVIDPLGGEDEEDLDDLIASWEAAEDEINAENVADVTVSSTLAEEAELNVTAAFLADQQRKAFELRMGETGIRPAGLNVPKELFGDGVIKQKAKLREMNTIGYKQPLDFAELAQKRLSRELIEMPMATNSFYLDVGGSASDGPFSAFSFQSGVAEIAPGTPKFQTLLQLAGNFAGQKYDLNNPGHRKQMRMRLLRMFNQRAKPILKELADAYFQKFNRPLRVTSLTRSMDYQILLNSNNPNSFKVRGEGSLPPHTSGCAFDLARKHMTTEEQNFVMAKLAQMESANKLDALIEYGANACFHVFIYSDGMPPRM